MGERRWLAYEPWDVVRPEIRFMKTQILHQRRRGNATRPGFDDFLG